MLIPTIQVELQIPESGIFPFHYPPSGTCFPLLGITPLPFFNSTLVFPSRTLGN